MADSHLNLYAEKTAEYFSRARTEIAPLLSGLKQTPYRVLEIGCAEGHTLEWLKKTGNCGWAAGVEPYAELRCSPETVDQFYKLNIEEFMPDIASESLDMILCLDVLEHLVDPWKTVRRLDTLLKPGGLWIISVPNIRNYHILADLAFRGRFNYTESGILDRTHLRFFTRASAVAMMEGTGARVTQIIGTETNRWQKRLLCALGFEDLLARQFILKAIKSSLS